MSNKTDIELKQTFQTGDVPTEAQFGDLIDSSRNMYLDKSGVANGTTFNEGGCTFTFGGSDTGAEADDVTDNITFAVDSASIQVGDTVIFTALGNLSAGLSLNTTYYVVSIDRAGGTFKVSETKGGSVVDITSFILGVSYTYAHNVAFVSDNSASGILDIPWKPYECRIENDAWGAIGITSLNIPPNITTIGDGAFVDCTFAGKLKIHDSVTTIGSEAFYDSIFSQLNITDIELGKGLTSIGSNAFYGIFNNIIPEIVIPESMVDTNSIGSGAFYFSHDDHYVNSPAAIYSDNAFGFGGGPVNIYVHGDYLSEYIDPAWKARVGSFLVTPVQWTSYPDLMP